MLKEMLSSKSTFRNQPLKKVEPKPLGKGRKNPPLEKVEPKQFLSKVVFLVQPFFYTFSYLKCTVNSFYKIT
jgi:hypothetical protein